MVHHKSSGSQSIASFYFIESNGQCLVLMKRVERLGDDDRFAIREVLDFALDIRSINTAFILLSKRIEASMIAQDNQRYLRGQE